MATGSLLSDRKIARVIGAVEKELTGVECNIESLEWLEPEFNWYKDELEEIADEAHTMKACVLAVDYLETNQNLSYSTMRYPDRQSGDGQRVGSNSFLEGPPALGKNQIVTLLKDIQAETEHNNDEFLKKYSLNFNRLSYSYLFTVARHKVMLEEANKRDGQVHYLLLIIISIIVNFLFVVQHHNGHKSQKEAKKIWFNF